MKKREDVVVFIGTQFNRTLGAGARERGGHGAYGKQELRELLDFIYEEEPASNEQQLNCKTYPS